jgi:hypothetical protein
MNHIHPNSCDLVRTILYGGWSTRTSLVWRNITWDIYKNIFSKCYKWPHTVYSKPFPDLPYKLQNFKETTNFLKKLHKSHNMEPQKYLVINISKIANGLNNLNISTLSTNIQKLNYNITPGRSESKLTSNLPTRS